MEPGAQALGPGLLSPRAYLALQASRPSSLYPCELLHSSENHIYHATQPIAIRHKHIATPSSTHGSARRGVHIGTVPYWGEA